MRGNPLSLVLVSITIKSVWYSHESIDTIMYSKIPFGHAVELLAICRIVMVCLKYGWRFNISIVSLVITLIATPKSIKVFSIIFLLIFTFTTRLLGLGYLGSRTLPNFRSMSFPMTLIVGGYFFIFPTLLIQDSLMNLL